MAVSRVVQRQSPATSALGQQVVSAVAKEVHPAACAFLQEISCAPVVDTSRTQSSPAPQRQLPLATTGLRDC